MQQFQIDTKDTRFPKLSLNNPEQIDKVINDLNKTISDLVDKNSSEIQPSDPNQDLPHYITRAIALKRTLQLQWHRSRNPDIKTALNRQTALVHDFLQTHRDRQWDNFLGSMDNLDKGWTKI